MLDTGDKVLEKFIKPRLLQAIKYSGDLSDGQYGFRKGRSTVDASNSSGIHKDNRTRKPLLAASMPLGNVGCQKPV